MARIAWVIGASSGIGQAVAKRLANDGWAVVASARGEAALIELAATQPNITPLPLDVSDTGAVNAAAAQIKNDHGSVDLLLLAAGVWHPMRAGEYDVAKFAQSVDVNVLGFVRPIVAVVNDMMARRSGHIAIISSVSGYRGLPRAGAYGPTKAALINLAETLRGDLQTHGIKVQVINPGFVDTPMTAQNDFPMPFILTVDKAADHIMRGLKSSRFEIAFPWQLVWMLKSLRALPYGVYFWVMRTFVEKGDK